MTISNLSQLRQSFGIPDDKLKCIKAFIQGSVYCWIKNRKDEIFAARDLMGGENFYWEGTPLMALYEKHIALGKSSKDSVAEAGKDFGWILKLVLHEDKRIFESYDIDIVKGYKWNGQEA